MYNHRLFKLLFVILGVIIKWSCRKHYFVKYKWYNLKNNAQGNAPWSPPQCALLRLKGSSCFIFENRHIN